MQEALFAVAREYGFLGLVSCGIFWLALKVIDRGVEIRIPPKRQSR